MVLGERDSALVQRLCAAADVCPEPVGAFEPSSVATAQPVSADQLPWHREICASDRLLLWSADPVPGAPSLLSPVAVHALARGADVWLVSRVHGQCAAELVDVLGITLCLGEEEPGTPCAVRCQNAAGETLEPGRTGWLVWAATQLAVARSVGYIDPHGWVQVLGAATQTMVLAEGLFTPFEGAACLEMHPRVTRASLLLLSASQCALAGLERGFFAVTEVTGQASPVLEVELLDYVRRGVSAAKCPQGILCVSELPTRKTGTPDSAALLALVEAQFELLSVV